MATSPSIFASLNVCQMAARNSGAFRSRAASANEIRRSVDVDVYVPGLIERTFGPRLLAAAELSSPTFWNLVRDFSSFVRQDRRRGSADDPGQGSAPVYSGDRSFRAVTRRQTGPGLAVIGGQ